jgi:type IV pilus assembly protein PilC
MTLSKYTKLKVVTQWIIFHVPGIGRLVKEATVARFGVILGGLLRSGVPLVEALESLHDVTEVAKYKKFYKKLWKRIELGDSFASVFKGTKNTGKLLPVSVQQLVITGEKSGTLANTLLKVADIYEKKAEATAEKLPVILEPILLLVIGSLVTGIAMSIIVPIYSIVGTIGG